MCIHPAVLIVCLRSVVIQISADPQPTVVGGDLDILCSTEAGPLNGVQLRFGDGSTNTDRGFIMLTLNDHFPPFQVVFFTNSTTADLHGMTVRCVLAELASEAITLQVLSTLPREFKD